MENIEISHNGDVKKGDRILGCIEGFRFQFARLVQEDDEVQEGGERPAELQKEISEQQDLPVPLLKEMPKSLEEISRKDLSPLLQEEYTQRAQKLGIANDNDFSFSIDGFLRWEGQIIAQMKAGEDVLKPSLIVLLDEEVCGSVKDLIEERALRFLYFYLETTLKPLYNLKNADFLVGIPQKIKDSLLTHFGVLPRFRVASEMKELDQTGRVALRRLGVRFGAFNLFLPLMLKPQPAQILTFLWALYHDAKEDKGYQIVVQNLMAGRTSLLVDFDFNKEFYALSGYQIVGLRAVRVDILERLADLIRTMVSWTEGSSRHVDGALGNKKFYVTSSMLSILGATQEDMEGILESLGYAFETIEKADFTKKIAHLNNDLTLREAEPVGDFGEFLKSSEENCQDDSLSPIEKNFEASAIIKLWFYKGKRTDKREKTFQRKHEKTFSAQIDKEKNSGFTTAKTKGAFKFSKTSKARLGENSKDKRDGKPSKSHFQNTHNRAKPKFYSFNTESKMRDKDHIDPDSPFAALQHLRGQLAEKE